MEEGKGKKVPSGRASHGDDGGEAVVSAMGGVSCELGDAMGVLLLVGVFDLARTRGWCHERKRRMLVLHVSRVGISSRFSLGLFVVCFVNQI